MCTAAGPIVVSAPAPLHPPIDVTAEQWRIIHDVLQANVPDATVWAFGSRVAGRAKAYSDLDIAIVSDEPLGFMRMAEIAEAFTESDLPWKVDVVDWAATSERFQQVIERDHVELQRGHR